MITLKSFDKEEFVSEMQRYRDAEIQGSKEAEIRVCFNDALLKNIEVFFDVLSKLDVKKIIFVKDENDQFDIVCFSIARRFFEANFAKISIKYTILFEGLTDLFVINKMIGQRNYFLYCNMKKVTTKWNEYLLNKEKELVAKYSYMEKYDEFKLFKSEFEKNPFSSFNFPKEKDVDRFVYYYYIYDELSQKTFLEYMQKTGFKEKYLDFVKKTPVNNPIMYYCLGFSYKEGKVIRRTLYFSFYNPFDTDSSKEYLKKIFGFDIFKFKFNNIFYAGIDEYETYEEMKIYEESHLFTNVLEDIEIGNILRGKVSTHVFKFKGNKLVNEKFEFNLERNFTENEKEVLIKNELISKEHKVLAIYLKEGKIIKSALYEL